MPTWQPSPSAVNLATYCATSPGNDYCRVSGNSVSISSTLPTNNYYVLFGSMPTNPSNFSNTGQVTLYKNISLNGSLTVYNGSITFDGNPNASNGSGGLALSAFGGNITDNGNADVTGVLYAPQGTVTLNGGGNVYPNVLGAIIGDHVDIPGHISVEYNASEVAAVPNDQVALIQ
ncbi:MAG: DUF7305 domain-containing protein [Sulfobacillus sp.]